MTPRRNEGTINETTALLTRHKLTVHDYHRMAEAGILRDDDRVELIDGEIIDMAAIGPGHASVVGRITRALTLACGDRVIVRVQSPVRLDEFNEPRPDFAILKPRTDFYETRHPGPADILLLVELSDSTLRYDLDVKLPMYARAGIPEVWIMDLRRRVLMSYRVPSSGQFTMESQHGPGDMVRLAAMANFATPVSELLGP